MKTFEIKKLKKHFLDMYKYVNSGETIPYPIILKDNEKIEVQVFKIIINEEGMWLFFNHPYNTDNLQILIPNKIIYECDKEIN